MNPSYNGPASDNGAGGDAQQPISGAGASPNNQIPNNPVPNAAPNVPPTPPQPQQSMMGQPMMQQRPMMGQTMMQQQPMMQQPMTPVNNYPVSTGTGDIILNTGTGKKSNKGVIIAIIAAFLIIGGIAAAMFLLPHGGASVNTKTAFNKYANYFLYGESSDKDLEGEYDDGVIYKYDEMRSASKDEYEGYFNTASGLLDTLELATSNSDATIVAAVNDYRGKFELAKLTFNKEPVDEESVYSQLTSSNLETTKNWIRTQYKTFSESQYENVKQYATIGINYYILYAEVLSRLEAAGCQKDDNCDIDSEDESFQNLEELSEQFEERKWSIDNDVIEGCWTLNDTLNGVTDPDTEEDS